MLSAVSHLLEALCWPGAVLGWAPELGTHWADTATVPVILLFSIFDQIC